MKRELKRLFAKRGSVPTFTIAEPIPMKRELKPVDIRLFWRATVEIAEPIPMKRELKLDPRYTSRTCSKCGFQKKENRNGRTFKCKSCGFQIDADLNASRNIATFSRSDRSRLPVNQPIVAG